MPIGEHLQRCLECGTPFICGDCLETICRPCQCRQHGHLSVGSICGRCGATLPKDGGSVEEVPFPPWTCEGYEARKALKEWTEATTPEYEEESDGR